MWIAESDLFDEKKLEESYGIPQNSVYIPDNLDLNIGPESEYFSIENLIWNKKNIQLIVGRNHWKRYQKYSLRSKISGKI